MLVDHDDNELMKKIQAGDKSAFEYLVHKYSSSVSAFLNCKVEACHVDDLSQETFLRIWKHRDKYNPIESSSFTSWLNTIIFNLCKTHYKACHRQKKIKESYIEKIRNLNGESKIIIQDKIDLISKTFDFIPPKERRMIKDYHFYGIPIKTIARTHNVNYSHVAYVIYKKYPQDELFSKIKKLVLKVQEGGK